MSVSSGPSAMSQDAQPVHGLDVAIGGARVTRLASRGTRLHDLSDEPEWLLGTPNSVVIQQCVWLAARSRGMPTPRRPRRNLRSMLPRRTRTTATGLNAADLLRLRASLPRQHRAVSISPEAQSTSGLYICSILEPSR